MNYLAHIFLSGTDKQIQLGNFIGDAVKGNSYSNYPQAISKGVLLHRAIDSYTDNHPVVKEAIQSLKPDFGRYSGILLDIYFDYLLASHFNEFSAIPLKKYSRNFYYTIIWNRRYLPDRIKRFMWHFIGTNRLYKYASKDGIKMSLKIMVSVGRIDIPVERAMIYLSEYEKELWNVFKHFFDELQGFCQNYIQTNERMQ